MPDKLSAEDLSFSIESPYFRVRAGQGPRNVSLGAQNIHNIQGRDMCLNELCHAKPRLQEFVIAISKEGCAHNEGNEDGLKDVLHS